MKHIGLGGVPSVSGCSMNSVLLAQSCSKPETFLKTKVGYFFLSQIYQNVICVYAQVI